MPGTRPMRVARPWPGRSCWPLAVAVLLAGCGPARGPAVESLELHEGWLFRGASDSAWIPATVPGTVHTDLLSAGRIPDPFFGDREAELRWIEDEAWTYRLDFQVGPHILEHQRVDLIFEGLDSWATVTLNGGHVLEADNMFRTWRADVAGDLRLGSNTLEVRFDSPVERGRALAAAHPWPIPHQEPDAAGTRAFSRKAAYHFGWDWGPRYVTMGIWRPVRLDAWSGTRIAEAAVLGVIWQEGDTARVHVRVEVEAAGDAEGRPAREGGAEAGPVTPRPAGKGPRLGIRSPEGAFKPLVLTLPPMRPGARITVDTTVVFPDAEAWWPRGMGRSAGHLHSLEVDLVQDLPEDGSGRTRRVRRVWDQRTLRAGLRTVELVTRPDSLGESFFFRVNGEAVFARGANVIPPDHFTPRADSATYARLIDDAVAANMNMLRVWGGGVYLPDVFYDLADEAGVLVWQDFMFANTLVPGDEKFAASVAAEARDQIRRLRGHPSIALWCGNNEIAEGWANWGWQERYPPDVALQVDDAYRRIFHQVLPAAVAQDDPSRPYWPSSPSLGWGNPGSLVRGDSHYWGVWWGMEPFRVYAEKVPRFASEFGFQALPDPVTVGTFTMAGRGAAGATQDATGPPPLTASLDDPVIRAHQKHPTGFETIRAYVEREWPVPAVDSLDAWSYVTQLAQAEGVGLALEAHRRAWPSTGGTLYWQLNDSWPVVSWSSVDWFGRWKALHYRARRVFAPLAVMADSWGDTVAVWAAADGAATAATLTVRALDFHGTVLATHTAAVPLDGSRSTLGWRGTAADLIPDGVDRRGVVVEARVDVQGISTARDLVFLAPPAALLLPDPGLRVTSVELDGEAFRVTLRAERFAYAVRLSLDGIGARYSDNFIHLLPGESVTVRVVPETPTPDFPTRLRLRTLNPPPSGSTPSGGGGPPAG